MRYNYVAWLFVILLSSALCCTVDEDCNLNGICQSGACVCQSAWKGSDCGQLNLLQSPKAGAYNVDNNSSWGGGVVSDSDGYYHLYFALMLNHCGLNTWTNNSEIAHGIAKSPLGPFQFEQSVLPAFAHNPQPFLWNDTYFIFHIGCGTKNIADLNQCVNGSTPSNSGKSRTSNTVHDSGCVDWAVSALMSKSPYGPWVNTFLFQGSMPNQPWPVSADNPSAHIDSDGTTMVMFRSWFANSNGWNSTIGIATAPHPLGPYTVPQEPIFLFQNEDPFLWQDTTTGHFHALFHAMQNMNGSYFPGVHAYSRDGKSWTMSTTPAYDATIDYDDGSSVTLSRRERPQLRFDPTSGKPTHLYNGALLSSSSDKTFTLVTAINTD